MSQPALEADAPAGRSGFWASVKEALAGGHRDYTEGSLPRAVWMLAVPMVLEMAMESVFAVLDILFVARIGPWAPAAVGLTESMLIFVYCIAIGLSTAATATVARRVGEKRTAAAQEAALQAILLATLWAVALGVAGLVFAPQLLRLMGAAPEVVAQGTAYARIQLGSNVVIFLLYMNNAVLRGAGDASAAMRALWLANAVNLVLDPCLIFGLGPFPRLGLTGAAIGTAVGRGVGVAWQLAQLYSGRRRLSLRGLPLRADRALMRHLMHIAWGGIIQFLIGSASWVALIRIVSSFGTLVLSGYQIAIRIIVFAFLPAWGLSNAAATLVGQNLGAGKPDRAERAVWLTGLYNMAFLAVVTLVFCGMPGLLIRIFDTTPAVVAAGTDCLRIISYGYVFYAWEMITVQAFNGAGDTRTPTWVAFFCFWVFQAPLAWVLAMPEGSRIPWAPALPVPTFGLGPSGVYWACALAYSLSAVVGVLLFRRGRWKRQQV